MRLLGALIAFELSYYLRRISTHLYFAIFFGLGVLVTAIAGGAFKSVAASVGGSGGIVHANSPLVIAGFTGSLGIFAVLIVTAVMGNAVFRDYEAGIHPLFFTTPVPKWTFLAGRFIGAFLVNAWIFLSIPLGIMAGLLIPTLMEDRIGPFRLEAYFQPYALMLLPTLLFTGAIFFSLAAFTRKMLPNYLGGVVFLVAYILAGNLLGDMENKTVAALLDPFGMSAFGVVTEYWTASERNSLLLPAFSLIGLNRLLWLGIGVAIFAACAWRFRFSHQAIERGPGWLSKLFEAKSGPEPEGANVGMGVALSLPAVSRDHSGRGQLAQAWSVFKRSFAAVALNVYFPAIAGAGLLFLVLSAGEVGKIYGTPTWPVTYQVLEVLGGTFALFTVIIIAFYVGELVWQERDLHVSQITDTMPSATWSTFVGKLAALCVVVGSLQLVVLVAGLLTQVARGFDAFNVPLYFKVLLGLNLSEFVLVTVLAFVVHVVVNQKYLGHVVMVLTYFGIGFMGRLGLEHKLYQYGGDPGWQFSDMNQFGPFLMPWGWFKLYWGAVAVLLAVLVNVLWVRGQETTPAWRLSLARGRFSGRAVGIAATALLVALGAGGYIFWNTNIRNTYRTSFEQEELQVRYEKSYEKYAGIPQPRVVAVQVHADLYPKEGNARFKGTHVLRNKTGSAIPQIHVILPSFADVKLLEFIPPATLESIDEDLGYRIYELSSPLAPGQTLVCSFDVAYTREGFTNSGADTNVVENGTFVNSGVTPSYGYSEDGELSDDDTRKKHGLEPKERMAKVDDPVARRDTYISRDSDWVGFEASVTTDADQIAIAPGYLKSDVTVGNRRTFTYAMDAPILHFYSFLSARYAVKKDSWNDVALEIYYHPGHEYNLDRMIMACKKSLDYYTREFGPYQHRQLRILEFPRYATFAQAFPNTIPFSEGIGFIARLDEETNIDYPFYVTAHEIAHQWWAHQCIGGNVQGSTLLSESMSQYSALMVMEKEYGPEQMRRFLKYELNSYLQGRAFERKKELPLALVENQQYIHYRKGSVVLYALRDYLGEETMNAAIRGYLERVKFQEPPYTNSLEFVEAIRAATPSDLQGLIDDLFMNITLWDLRAKEAFVEELPDGKFKVSLKIDAKKFRADGSGTETEMPLDLPIDIGVFAEGDTSDEDDDVPLLFEKRRIVSGEATLELVVDKKPVRAGIDPYHKLIDRRSDDNTAKVKDAPAPST